MRRRDLRVVWFVGRGTEGKSLPVGRSRVHFGCARVWAYFSHKIRWVVRSRVWPGAQEDTSLSSASHREPSSSSASPGSDSVPLCGNQGSSNRKTPLFWQNHGSWVLLVHFLSELIPNSDLEQNQCTGGARRHLFQCLQQLSFLSPSKPS